MRWYNGLEGCSITNCFDGTEDGTFGGNGGTLGDSGSSVPNTGVVFVEIQALPCMFNYAGVENAMPFFVSFYKL